MKHRISAILAGAALCLGPAQLSLAVTARIAANIEFAGSAVVGRTSDIGPIPARLDPTLFMDPYRITWASTTQSGIISIANSTDQVMNILFGDYSFNPTMVRMELFCSRYDSQDDSCNKLLSPAGSHDRVVYIGMDVMVRSGMVVATAAPSFDISVVYQ